MAQVTMRDLLEAGVHFGHQTNRWNPKMRPYIYGARNGIHIIDLSQTVRLFAEAYTFLTQVASRGDAVLFVGTKKQAQDAVREQAERANQYFVVNRWLGGTLTNYRTIRNSIDRLKELDKMSTDGSYAKYTKKEVLMFERERERLDNNVGGIQNLGGLPGALFVIDPKKEDIAIKEAVKLGIPVVAVCDTNCDPKDIDYVIPGNDDAIRAVRLFSSAVAEACLEGAKLASSKREASAREAAQAATSFNAPAKRDRAEPEVQKVSRPEVPKAEAPKAEAPKPEAAEGGSDEAQTD
ncbi:MAG: 30S ribosomal protein S2 [Bradymonadaceae bacterium]